MPAGRRRCLGTNRQHTIMHAIKHTPNHTHTRTPEYNIHMYTHANRQANGLLAPGGGRYFCTLKVMPSCVPVSNVASSCPDHDDVAAL